MIVSNELERRRRKRSWPNLRYYPRICLKGLRKILNKVFNNIRCTCHDSNPTTTEYMSEALLFEPAFSVIRASYLRSTYRISLVWNTVSFLVRSLKRSKMTLILQCLKGCGSVEWGKEETSNLNCCCGCNSYSKPVITLTWTVNYSEERQTGTQWVWLATVTHYIYRVRCSTLRYPDVSPPHILLFNISHQFQICCSRIPKRVAWQVLGFFVGLKKIIG
jgi:hypothetical protein